RPTAAELTAGRGSLWITATRRGPPPRTVSEATGSTRQRTTTEVTESGIGLVYALPTHGSHVVRHPFRRLGGVRHRVAHPAPPRPGTRGHPLSDRLPRHLVRLHPIHR